MNRLRRPTLRQVLLLANLVILALPLLGIHLLRLYEGSLIHQTESALIGQASFLAASFRASLRPLAPALGLSTLGHPQPADALATTREPWHPRPASIDLRTDPILPYPAPPAASGQVIAPSELQAGRAVMEVMRDAQITTLAGMRVVDDQGLIIASTARSSNDEVGRSIADRFEVRRALLGEHVSVLRERPDPTGPLESLSRGARVRVYVAMPIVLDGRIVGAVVVHRTPRTIVETLRANLEPLLAWAAVMLALVIGVAWFTSRTVSQPLALLSEQARRVGGGKQQAVTAPTALTTREIFDLAEAVGRMERDLERRNEYIRDFSSHVSHEFKSPLTSIRGAVELLREHGATMTAQDRERFLANMASDTDRLQRLVDALLELARADALRPNAGTCDVAALLPTVDVAHVEIVTDVQSDVPAATIDPELLHSVLLNLCHNSREHGARRVGLKLRHDAATAQIRLTISDDGPGIDPANASKIFEPFFTTRRGQGGTGLGLALARALLRAQRSSIEMVPSEHGARFEIMLPAVDGADDRPPSAA